MNDNNPIPGIIACLMFIVGWWMILWLVFTVVKTAWRAAG